jgi:NhaA family Na+:H+ antiporter
MLSTVRRFIASESAGGVLLAVAALAALLISNSALGPLYTQFLTLRFEVRIANDWLVLAKPLLLWVNDLWMAVFFFLVGLEIKRELLEGELVSARQAVLPAVAIIDDLGAIVIIAAFYTDALSPPMLLAAGVGAALLFALNRARVVRLAPYVIVGLVVWVCVLKSGVHATLAGVVTALAVPMRDPAGGSPLENAEHGLHPWVAFAVLPMFAFANAGVSLQGVSVATLLQPVPLGITVGLVVGKALGVFSASWLLVKLSGGRWPASANTAQFFAVCLLCGVGFTMSLFIGGLAFEGQAATYETQLKIGVLFGSMSAAALGVALFLLSDRPSATP